MPSWQWLGQSKKWWELSIPTFLCWCKSVQDHWSWWRLCLFISPGGSGWWITPLLWLENTASPGKSRCQWHKNLNGVGGKKISRTNSLQIRRCLVLSTMRVHFSPSIATRLNWGCQNISYGVFSSWCFFPLLPPGSYLPAHVLPHERATITNPDLWRTRKTRWRPGPPLEFLHICKV